MGGQRKRSWEDNFNNSQRPAEDCRKWQKIVVNGSGGAVVTVVVPGST